MKKTKIALILVLAMMIFLLTSCGDDTPGDGGITTDGQGSTQEITGGPVELEDEDMNTDNMTAGEQIAVIHTSMGDITVRLFPEIAPKAVENFLTHAENGYYDGVIFHRVIWDFMIQTGDPDGTGSGGESIWGSNFEDEFSPNARHVYGSLAMANRGPATNGSQFYIVQNRDGTPWLDGKHTVFGQVIRGMTVVEAIAAVPVVNAAAQDYRPVDTVQINSISVEEWAG